jgi:spermidine synthase
MNSRPDVRIYIATSMIAFCTLLFEIALTRIFSVLTWHHFTPMIVSIALLGFGMAGSFITLKNKTDAALLSSSFIARNAFWFGFSALFSLLLITRIYFEPLAITKDWTQLLSLFSYYVLLTIPFFFAGLCLGSIVSLYQKDISRVYFSDLLGASTGCLVSTLAIQTMGVTNLVFFIALLGGVTGLIMDSFQKGWGNGKNWLKVSFLALCLAAGLYFDPYLVHVPPSKPLFYGANPWKTDSDIIFSRWSVVGRIDITRPIRRVLSAFGGEISPLARTIQWEHIFIYQDGQAPTGILKSDGDLSKMPFLRNYLQAAPYAVKKNPKVLVIGIGGGIDGLIALAHGATEITGVDVNPFIIDAITKKYARYAGGVFNRPDVKTVVAEGRHFLSRNAGRYDVIQLSGVDTFTALASGAYALTENYLYTTEAIKDYWSHLSDDGVLSFSRWYFKPPRETLRLSAMMIKAIEELGVTDPFRHMAIVNGASWAETLLKKTAFTPQEMEALRDWARSNRFQIMYDPDKSTNSEFDKVIRSPVRQREEFFHTYVYNVRPASDDRPFFFDYYKWTHLFRKESGEYGFIATSMPLSLWTLVLSLLQILFLAIFGILYPQLKLKRALTAKGRKPAIIFYFGALGLGFIFIEIALIQKLMVFLGGPTYSFSITLFSILLFSGFGSYFTRTLDVRPRRVFLVLPLLLVLLSLGVNLALSLAIPQWLGFSLPVRSLLAVLVLSPLAFVMGMPFPSGIRLLSRYEPGLVPWAWAINSFMTVFGSIFCIFLSMMLGFQVVFVMAGLIYALGFLFIQPVARRAG